MTAFKGFPKESEKIRLRRLFYRVDGSLRASSGREEASQRAHRAGRPPCGCSRQVTFEIFGRHRPGQQEALRLVATGAVKKRQLRLFLDAFGDDAEIQLLGECDDAGDDRRTRPEAESPRVR